MKSQLCMRRQNGPPGAREKGELNPPRRSRDLGCAMGLFGRQSHWLRRHDLLLENRMLEASLASLADGRDDTKFKHPVVPSRGETQRGAVIKEFVVLGEVTGIYLRRNGHACDWMEKCQMQP